MSHYFLDVRRLLCPLPVIRVQDKIKTLISGDTLEVVCTDPGVLQDIPAWCRVHGHEVISCRREARDIIVTVTVKHATK